MRIRQWQMVEPGAPLRLVEREAPPLAPGEVWIEVAGCGICHTDLGFLHGGVKTRKALPLTLGHEVSGTVVEAPAAAGDLAGAEVIVPAVIPCEECALCRKGRGAICPRQVFLGNDVDGGFASHLAAPARALCRVPDRGRVPLAELAVIADAVSTPYQSIRRSGLGPGDLAVFVGAGGVGAFGVQIARALGATVAAIDVDRDRLDLVRAHGASLTLDATVGDVKAMKKRLREHARDGGLPETEWKIFETSGTRAGQETAFQLLVHGAYLGVVGYTPEKASVPVSHLMAFDARAEGNWGCSPRLYPEVLALVLAGKVAVAPFVEVWPLASINEVLTAAHDRKLKRRPIVVPGLG